MPFAIHRFPIFASFAAATALAASPAVAAEVPRADTVRLGLPHTAFGASAYDAGLEQSQWGCWGCGWGGGWYGGGWGGGWRRRGPSAGEVLAGVAIVGGIAAIAANANNNRRNRTRDVVIIERDRDFNDPRDFDDRDLDRRNYDRREGSRPPRMGGAGTPRSGTGGLEAAARQCASHVSRDVRVESVDTVERTAQGWLVGGALFNGTQFECRIGNDGRIQGVDYGAAFIGGAGAGAASGGQWDDTRYAAARRSALPSQPDPNGGIQMMQSGAPAPAFEDGNERPLVPLEAQRLPAYPGGPIDDEEPVPLVQRPGIP